MKAYLYRLVREPLFHFALVGSVLFLAIATLSGPSGSPGRQITVDRVVIERLAQDWEVQYGLLPTAEQTRSLVEAHIEDETAYREALALGLDRDDIIIRRRLIQKLRFLSESLAPLPEPSQSELSAFYEENSPRYTEPERTSFQHVYFSRDQRRDSARQDANALRKRLTAEPAESEEWRTAGDPFVLQKKYASRNEREVTELFGEVFATTLRSVPLGPWAGPIPSTYGWHVVRVLERPPPSLLPLSQISEQVTADWKEAQRESVNQALRRERRKKYDIRIEGRTATVDDAQRQPKPEAKKE